MTSGQDTRLRASDGEYFSVYLAGAAEPRRPGIMLFSPIFGVDEDIKSLADRWATRGYLVASPDYFFRVAPGVLDRSEAGRKLAFERWEKLDVDRTIEDMKTLASFVRNHPCCSGALGALGYCAGGELAFLAGSRLDAEAVATFHGTRIDRHLGEAAQIKGRLTLHFGGNDPLVPNDQVDAIRSGLADHPQAEIHVYHGAGHGFSFAGRPSYHEGAAHGSDQRAQEVFVSLNSALAGAP
jgi:carboxymethylenebutenolidase